MPKTNKPKNEDPTIKAFDCVEMKRRAQQEILEEIEGGSFRDELEAIHKLAEKSPLWKKLRKRKPATAKKTAKKTKPAAKRRKAG